MLEPSCYCHCQWGEPDTSASLSQTPTLPGSETHLGGTHLTPLAGSLHCSFGYEHLFCQTPMGSAGLSKLCLGSSIVTLLPACHMNPSKRLSPEGLGSHSCPLPDNSSTGSCRRTESTSLFAIAHENVPRYRYIQIRVREREMWLSF